MANHVGAERSVETLQAYLMAFLQSLPDAQRDAFVERLDEEAGFMVSVLSMLHATHDAMVSCLHEADVVEPNHAALLLESTGLFDSDLSSVVCCTLAKFSPAIVMDLSAKSAALPRVRLTELLAAVRARVVGIKLH